VLVGSVIPAPSPRRRLNARPAPLSVVVLPPVPPSVRETGTSVPSSPLSPSGSTRCPRWAQPRNLISVGDEGGLLTSQELARRLSVNRRTVARWVREGRLKPAYTTPGGQYRFRWDEVRKQLGLREPNEPTANQ
jgi:excisionase family DNA binding protein